ncbi:hypothetical protein A1O3_05734 [Capronia epimyces CBS 606.96]|uniref:U1-type domain-containing protein n=1 Tax=Capronia epimyces CBS 606.96 TaxID=1182542 RepID=W9YS00_9EURO|nr:uncharacterized protein A1O3_05734 [Capronia epimyces CBS 606.96]EXJ85059.1 hypothetical protein A1O3_05734 [Capronia epimyces CBS 606.96]
MSEYWKSTPKYWCKHCSAYVKDTPFERKQHESTGKHQGNLRRFLRDIQNSHERSEREKERAKSEVERLSKVASGSTPTSSIATTAPAKSQPLSVPKPPTQAAADLKRQWAQLADMGIKVPEKARSEMAMPGEWKAVERQTINEAPAEEARNIGVRKRKYEDQEEEEEVEETIVNRVWGSTTKRYPGDDKADLDELLSGTISLKKEKNNSASPLLKDETKEALKQENDAGLDGDVGRSEGQQSNKVDALSTDNTLPEDTLVKGEIDTSQSLTPLDAIPEEVPLPVFKRRKAKAS